MSPPRPWENLGVTKRQESETACLEQLMGVWEQLGGGGNAHFQSLAVSPGPQTRRVPVAEAAPMPAQSRTVPEHCH